MAVLETGEPFGRISVNLPDVDCPPINHFHIKTYSENAWVTQLIEQGYMEETGNSITKVYTTHKSYFPIWELTEKGLKELSLDKEKEKKE